MPHSWGSFGSFRADIEHAVGRASTSQSCYEDDSSTMADQTEELSTTATTSTWNSREIIIPPHELLGSEEVPVPISTRIQRLMEEKKVYPGNDLEFDIECSREHWSELNTKYNEQKAQVEAYIRKQLRKSHVERQDSRCGPFARGLVGRGVQGNNSNHKSAEMKNSEQIKNLKMELTDAGALSDPHRTTNRELFESMQSHPKWNGFFKQIGDRIEYGRKIGEGSQAEVYEVRMGNEKLALKVFKDGSALRDLLKQWPHGIFRSTTRLSMPNILCSGASSVVYGKIYTCPVNVGILLLDGRFALPMVKCDGDLRQLIDFKMRENENLRPPFGDREALAIMVQIARGMQALHDDNIVHRDLKASNVLFDATAHRDGGGANEDENVAKIVCMVADFECTIGVVGTGFWRAPEVLVALKFYTLTLDTFTKKTDVYSYGMTCYEILTGRVPFEGEHRSDACRRVLEGQRPNVPDFVHAKTTELLARCWRHDPSKRPTFRTIVKQLHKIQLELNDAEF